MKAQAKKAKCRWCPKLVIAETTVAAFEQLKEHQREEHPAEYHRVQLWLKEE